MCASPPSPLSFFIFSLWRRGVKGVSLSIMAGLLSVFVLFGGGFGDEDEDGILRCFWVRF